VDLPVAGETKSALSPKKHEKSVMGSVKRPWTFTREDYLERAEEMRTLADEMSTPDAKEQMIGVAESYEQLAKYAPEKAAPMAQVKLPELQAE
jgi:hypothetical protein